ncbi:MAG: magnesium transporter [Dehalococcoidia bacterium]|nr:magnesium transporter [Dehalococcoidia bacterium]
MSNDTGIRENIPPEEAARVVSSLLGQGQGLEAFVRFQRLLPPDQADVFTQLSDEHRERLITNLSAAGLAGLLKYLGTDEAVEFADIIGQSTLPFILDIVSPDVAADILKEMPPESAAAVIGRMKTAEQVAPLLEYANDEAGGLMSPQFVALYENMSVSQAMTFVRQWAAEYSSEEITQAFVVDRNGVLRGSIGLASLVLARPHQLVSLIMDSRIVSVTSDTDREEVARIVERYDLYQIPVTDDDGKLLGIIVVEDIIDVFEDEATEDMYRMIGVSETEKASGSFWRSVRSRLPWICVNLSTAILAGLVITLFESTMAKAIALAAFLPVVAGQGGITGTQTLTLMVRSIALGELNSVATWKLLWKELRLGLVHGLVVGLVVAAIAFGWQQNEYIAIVVGIATLASMTVAGISGILVPIGFRALKIDPALASAVAVTTVTNVAGFLIYLGLAATMIQFIVG